METAKINKRTLFLSLSLLFLGIFSRVLQIFINFDRIYLSLIAGLLSPLIFFLIITTKKESELLIRNYIVFVCLFIVVQFIISDTIDKYFFANIVGSAVSILFYLFFQKKLISRPLTDK